jgi:hypothetical protein
MSMRSGRVCSPRLMKLTASTMTTASISTLTNSPTERLTAAAGPAPARADAHGQLGLDALHGLAQRACPAG